MELDEYLDAWFSLSKEDQAYFSTLLIEKLQGYHLTPAVFASALKKIAADRN